MDTDFRRANIPNFESDQFVPVAASYRFDELVNRTMDFVCKEQLLDTALWARFVEQFRCHSDSSDAGWRGEFWGKMMRGACFVYSYTKDEVLYEILAQTVSDILNSADELGRISTYSVEKEFTGWDIWGRKYVLLGLQYFLEICKDTSLAERIVACMRSQVDYIMERIGSKYEGKKPITIATNHWRGLNSSSILEPVVRLYNLTKEEKYLSFAKYIVDEGGTSVVNVFRLAEENVFYPYQYPITKAYEMISCFEGLLEYYRISKEKWQKTAIINFANRILESDFTVIGCSGCSSELFDHSTVRQSNPDNPAVMQETCVTVTLMKFFYQLTLLTGASVYADAFETSFYNAYLGAVNTQREIDPSVRTVYPDAVKEPMPFDSYSPLTAGRRGNGIGGLKLLPDNRYYGCCACIGSMGIGLVPKMAVMEARDGVVLNFYMSGIVAFKDLTLTIDGRYPLDGEVTVTIKTDRTDAFKLYLRNPAWSKNTIVKADGLTEKTEKNGYLILTKHWKSGDVIKIAFDIRTEVLHTQSYGSQILMNKVIWGQNYMISTYDKENPKAKDYIALRQGPIVLAADEELGYDVAGVFPVAVTQDGFVPTTFSDMSHTPFDHIIKAEIPLSNGKTFTMVDYASAGKKWNNGRKIAAWIATK